MTAPARHNTASPEALTEEQKRAVRAQVDKILEDPLFRDTTRMKRFLRYVSEEALAGRGKLLKGYTIGLEVFDKPSDFDPQLDTIVRVQAGQLRRRLDLYYAGNGQNDPIRLTIPKGRYCPRFEVRSQMNEGEELALEAPPKLIGSPKEIKGPPSIAVVTFSDLSPSDGRDYFAEGLTTEIVSALVQFRHIRVLTLRSSDIDPTAVELSKTIGAAHNVEFVLSGSVRRAGSVFRVVVNLSSAKTGHILYTKGFDREYQPDAIFELQESIASNVAAAVAAPFGQINRHNRRLNQGRRQSMGAYEAVLRFYRMGLQPRQGEAEALLKDVEAITRDNPNFSTGFAIRSMLHTFMVTQITPSADPDTNLKAARELAERARRIDGQNGMAYFALFQALFHSGDIEEAQDKAQIAMSLNPNDYAMLSYLALTQADIGNVEAAEAYDQSARRLVSDPPHWFDVAQLTLAFRRGDDEAVLRYGGEITKDTSVVFPLSVSSSLGHLGRADEGKRVFELLSKGRSGFAKEAAKTLSYWQLDDHLMDRVVAGWKAIGVWD